MTEYKNDERVYKGGYLDNDELDFQDMKRVKKWKMVERKGQLRDIIKWITPCEGDKYRNGITNRKQQGILGYTTPVIIGTNV